jgi:uncharacterized membrane protein YbhN (UPF0104 family)
MFKNIRFYLTIALGLILYIFLIFKFVNEVKNTNLSPLFSFSNLILIIVCFLITILLIFSQSLFLKTIFETFNLEIGLKESIKYWLIFVATGVFTAGFSMPLWVFNKFKKLNKSSAESFFLILLYYIFCMFPIFLMLLIFFFNKILLALFLIFFIVLIVLIKVLQNMLNSEKFLKIIFKAILISFLSEFIYFLIFLLSSNMLSLNLKLIFILKSFLISQLSSIISPTSSGLGITEPIIVYYLSLYNLNIAKTILFTFLYRFFTFWIPAFLGAFILIRRK